MTARRGYALQIWVLLSVLLSIFPGESASAATLVVTNTDDSGPGSLRQAISDAGSGDTITFVPGMTGAITLTGGTLTLTKTITITGPGAGVLAVDGNSAVTVFSVIGGVTAAISGLTIQHGHASSVGHYGGGIYNLGGTVTLADSIVSGNSATQGGGIFSNGHMTLTNTAVTSNTTTTGGGGGIVNYASSGTMTLNNSVVSENVSAFNAGGIHTTGSQLTLNNSRVSGNQAISDGGGLVTAALATATLNNSTVSNNTSTSGNGGGIVAFGLGLTITASTISGNTAHLNGGGIDAAGSAIQIENSTISRNTANGGGGIYGGGTASGSGMVTLTNATVAANTTGIVVSSAASIALTNSLLANIGANCSGTIASGDRNLSSDMSCTAALTQPHDLVNVNPMLGPLAYNGGPTQTHALLQGSPAVDKGGTSASGCPATDQRGVGRPQGAACDIGALEATPDAVPVPRPPQPASGGGSPSPVPPTRPGPTGGTGVLPIPVSRS